MQYQSMDQQQEFRTTRKVMLQQQQQARSKMKHQKLKVSFLGYTVVLVFLALLQFIGVFFFAKGFLLSRSVLPDIAECVLSDGKQACFNEPSFEKAVLLVIDALRFDFVIPVEETHPEWNGNYHNNFPILYDLVQKDPNHAVLLKFLADPPTTTLQRLKGLTTGSLPTFIDAGSNFNGDAIDEDNWILQLWKANKSIAFMGDDTWTALFSKYMNPALNFPFDSLNVWDLHTVDNGVIDHLFPLLNKPASSSWDVLIGHMLGVDHVGHRYGPDHYAMKDKLKQMNQLVQDVVEKIDDKTLLIVMGDHGMDRTGNHGGDSQDELESTLFLYSKSKKSKFSHKAPQDYDTSELGLNYRAVNQIDLVPTVSLLLGSPIPFNNLGFPIDEAFASERSLVKASQLTVQQIMRYCNSSSEVNENLDVTDKYQYIMDQFSMFGTSKKHAESLISESKEFQLRFLEHCKSLWARFDLVLMSLGIAVLLLSLSVVITYSRSIPSVRVSTMSFEFIGSVIAMSLLGLVSGLSIFLVLRPAELTLRSCLLSGAAIGITIGFWAPILDRFSVMWLWHQVFDFFVFNLNWWSLLGLVFVVFHCLIFASNSFVVWEDKLVNFFIATFGFCCLYATCFSRKPKEQKILGIVHSVTFLVLSRLVMMINLCREEQMAYCKPSFATSRASVVLLYFSAFILPKVIKSFYSLSSSYHSAAPLWIETGLTSLMLMNAAYWTLEQIENDDGIQAILPDWVDVAIFGSFRLAIARIVLFVSLVLANFSWSRGPLCVKIEISEPDTDKTVESSKVEILEDEVSEESTLDADSNKPIATTTAATVTTTTSTPQPSAVILGYGNVYGSSYFLLVINIAVAILLVTKPVGALSLSALVVQILTLLELYNLLELRRNLIAPVMFVLLAYSHFFSTGHQATIASIQWEVGFMTTQTIVFPFTHLSIILNTFGSFLIVCLSVPLISLWKIPPSSKPITVLSQVITNVTTVITYQTLTSIMSFSFAAHFRRHLMVWKIFAPRFMLSALLMIVMNLCLVLLTTWFATGRVLTQVNRIFGK